MTALWWVSGVAISTGVAVAALGRGSEVLLGTVAPVIAAGASWIVMTRAWARSRVGLTGVMVQAFAAKMVFFAGYVGVVLGVLDTRPMPFVISFTVSFLATHLAEALCLRRLLAPGLVADVQGARQ